MENTDPVLIIGNDDLAASVALCLLNAKHHVLISTDNPRQMMSDLVRHGKAQKRYSNIDCDLKKVTLLSTPEDCPDVTLAIIITPENLPVKKKLLQQFSAILSPETVIAVNLESTGLNLLEKEVKHPEKLIGLNWTEPAHTTFFLEMIRTESNGDAIAAVQELASRFWGKDPYLVTHEGVRSRLVSALVREAAYLIENGYASIEDIDRACRNDAGYYLPFCGNCRYMDLMGTYAYGVVMKDLNPDLSKEITLPDFMTEKLKNGKRFYDYGTEGVNGWKESTEQFSYQIQSIIEKYPFNYLDSDFLD